MTSWGQQLALARRGSALARRRRLLRAFPRPRGRPHSAPLVARHSRPEASSARRLMFRRHDMRRRRRRRQAPARAAVPEASPRPRRLRTPPREGSSLEQPTNSVLCPHLCHLRLLRPARRHLRLRRRKRQPKRRRLPTAQRHGVWKRSDGWRRLADQAAPLRPPLARPDRLRCTSVGRRRRRADRRRKHSSPLLAFPLVVLQVDPKEEAPRPSTKQAVLEEDQWRDTTDLTAAERLGAPATCSVPARQCAKRLRGSSVNQTPPPPLVHERRPRGSRRCTELELNVAVVHGTSRNPITERAVVHETRPLRVAWFREPHPAGRTFRCAAAEEPTELNRDKRHGPRLRCMGGSFSLKFKHFFF